MKSSARSSQIDHQSNTNPRETSHLDAGTVRPTEVSIKPNSLSQIKEDIPKRDPESRVGKSCETSERNFNEIRSSIQSPFEGSFDINFRTKNTKNERSFSDISKYNDFRKTNPMNTLVDFHPNTDGNNQVPLDSDYENLPIKPVLFTKKKEIQKEKVDQEKRKFQHQKKLEAKIGRAHV